MHHEQFVEIPVSGSDLPVLRIKTDTGWRTLDSLRNPDGESKKLLENKNSDDLIVLGCGSGFLLKEIKKRKFKHVLIVTGSCASFVKNKMLLEDNLKITLDITLIYETSPSERLFTELRCFLEKFPRAGVIVHPGESKAYPNFFNPLCSYVECIKQNLQKKRSFRVRKVLFPHQDMILEPDIREEFCQRGIEVITLPSFAHESMSCDNAVKLLKAHNPDMVFSLNNRGSDRKGFIPDACRYAEIPWVTWFLDQPTFLVSEYECRVEQQRLAFCWDTAGIEPCKKLGFNRISLLPLGVNHRRFTPGPGKEELKGRLVYVGSPSFGGEERYFASLKRKPLAYRITDLFINSVIKSRVIPTVKEVYDAVNQEKISQGYFTEGEIKRMPAFILYTANLIYRVNALKAISDLFPIVYGDGWQGLLPDQITILPYVDYYRDLPEIYRSDCVHLSLTHLQMRYYPNQRIFDAGACGRPVINECLPGCKELFGNSFDDLFFTTYEELHEKAVMLLDNRNLRMELGEQLRTRIIENHTLSQRLDHILSCVESSAL